MPVTPVTKPVGIDLGTSTIKLSAGESLARIPSIIGEPNPGWTGMVTDKSWINNLVIDLGDDGEYYVGELARLQSEVKKPLASEGKMKSVKYTIIAIKAALSLIMKTGYEQFVIATGVPVATSQDEMLKLSRDLKGAHDIIVRNDATGETKELHAMVEKCFVMPEPYGTYFGVLKESGENRAVDAIIIDIGHGSTDILTMYAGRMIRTASGSLEEATDTLTNRLARALQDQTGKIIRPFDLMKVIEQRKNTIMIAGETWDIGDLVDHYSHSIAEVIVDETRRLLNNLPPDAWIEKVILTGGGAYVFGDHIKKLLWESNIVKSPDEVLIPAEPVMANAKGFELIAKTKISKS